MKLCRLPKIEGFILKYRVPPLWPTYIGERRTTIVKAFGLNLRYGEHVGEHIGNLTNILGTIWDKTEVLLGTSWGNKLGTSGTPWEQRKTTNPPPPPKLVITQQSMFSGKKVRSPLQWWTTTKQKNSGLSSYGAHYGHKRYLLFSHFCP
jgi:hypothetical protein